MAYLAPFRSSRLATFSNRVAAFPQRREGGVHWSRRAVGLLLVGRKKF
jgi:hypothetical protein